MVMSAGRADGLGAVCHGAAPISVAAASAQVVIRVTAPLTTSHDCMIVGGLMASFRGRRITTVILLSFPDRDRLAWVTFRYGVTRKESANLHNATCRSSTGRACRGTLPCLPAHPRPTRSST